LLQKDLLAQERMVSDSVKPSPHDFARGQFQVLFPLILYIQLFWYTLLYSMWGFLQLTLYTLR